MDCVFIERRLGLKNRSLWCTHPSAEHTAVNIHSVLGGSTPAESNS